MNVRGLGTSNYRNVSILALYVYFSTRLSAKCFGNRDSSDVNLYHMGDVSNSGFSEITGLVPFPNKL